MDSYERYLKTLARRRKPAMARAEELIRAGRYDDAEQCVRDVDDTVYGGVALAKLYEQILACGVGRLDERIHLFRRAVLSWHGAYPPAQTRVEAENYDRSLAEDRARLVSLLGFDPDWRLDEPSRLESVA